MTAGKRLAASGLLGLAATLLLPLAPANAQLTLSTSIDAPADGAVVSSSSTVDVSGTVNTGLAAVTGIQVVVTRGDGTVIVDRRLCCESARGGTVPFSLTTPALVRNGTYSVRATATGHIVLSGIATQPAVAQSSFALAVPPAPPRLDPPQLVDRTVRLAWTPGRADPDLMAYVVYRRIGTAGFAAIAPLAANVTTFVDDKLPPGGGSVQYRVDALRQGAVTSNNPNDWIARGSNVVTAEIPVPPTTTTPPGQQETTTTTVVAPPAGPQADGAVNNTDLSSLFQSAGGGVPSFPTPPTVTLPDTGYSELLPVPTDGRAPAIEGRQQGRRTGSSGTSELDAGSDDSNRRALLVPIAAGSVLCVTALHLRFLNRRLASASAAAMAATGAIEPLAGDLEPAEPDPLAFAPEPVGAGRPGP